MTPSSCKSQKYNNLKIKSTNLNRKAILVFVRQQTLKLAGWLAWKRNKVQLNLTSKYMLTIAQTHLSFRTGNSTMNLHLEPQRPFQLVIELPSWNHEWGKEIQIWPLKILVSYERKSLEQLLPEYNSLHLITFL